MDKVKVYLVLLKKHHFWVLSAIVIITALTGTLMAGGKLSTIYASQKTKIENEFKEVASVNGVEFHPNEKWKDGVTSMTQDLGKGVKKAWTEVYKEQKTVLVWPDVNADFSRKIKAIGPTDEIPLDMREDYFNYIKKEFQRLLDIVDAKKHDKREDRAIKRPQDQARDAREESDEHDYKVVWNNKNQMDIDSALDFSVVPTDQQVRNTQEDLWVYRALLTVIATLNEKATGHHNAKVKLIQSMLIGKPAADEFGEGTGPGHIASPASSQRPNAMAPAPAPPPPADGFTPPPAGSDAGRYVDEKGRPLVAGPATQEFKRMPVYLKLVMDQREISRLLVECANSPLPIEIRQLRLNPSKVKGPAGNATPVRPGAKGLGGPVDAESETGPFDLVVELHGIIYVFNPPSVASFGPAVDPSAAAQPADLPAAAPAVVAPAREPDKTPTAEEAVEETTDEAGTVEPGSEEAADGEAMEEETEATAPEDDAEMTEDAK